MIKKFSTKLNVEAHNMEVEAVATNEEMEVDQALDELFNNN